MKFIMELKDKLKLSCSFSFFDILGLFLCGIMSLVTTFSKFSGRSPFPPSVKYKLADSRPSTHRVLGHVHIIYNQWNIYYQWNIIYNNTVCDNILSINTICKYAYLKKSGVEMGIKRGWGLRSIFTFFYCFWGECQLPETFFRIKKMFLVKVIAS